MTGIYKWDEPTPTKSGESVVKLWNELLECWASYKKAKYIEPDETKAIEFAKKIRELQDDIGLTLTDFPELNL